MYKYLGNLVIYDLEGVIISQTGEVEGATSDRRYPVGIPYIELPYGAMHRKSLRCIDVTKEPHEPVFEEDMWDYSDAERIRELENQLLLIADSLEGGIL